MRPDAEPPVIILHPALVAGGCLLCGGLWVFGIKLLVMAVGGQ